MNRTVKVAQPVVPEPTEPVLTDPQGIARYVLQRFTDQELGATGALLLDQNGAPIGTLILEIRPDADLPKLATSLAGATTQIVPFLFRPASDPMVTDEEIQVFCDLLEMPLVDVTIPDCVYVWSTGNYLSRSSAGKVGCVDDEPKGEA